MYNRYAKKYPSTTLTISYYDLKQNPIYHYFKVIPGSYNAKTKTVTGYYYKNHEWEAWKKAFQSGVSEFKTWEGMERAYKEKYWKKYGVSAPVQKPVVVSAPTPVVAQKPEPIQYTAPVVVQKSEPIQDTAPVKKVKPVVEYDDEEDEEVVTKSTPNNVKTICATLVAIAVVVATAVVILLK